MHLGRGSIILSEKIIGHIRRVYPNHRTGKNYWLYMVEIVGTCFIIISGLMSSLSG